MLGVFLVNPEKEICFAQIADYQDIESVRYVSDAQACIFHLTDGTEELVNDGVHEKLGDHLKSVPQIFVVHVDEQGEALKEYAVPISHS